MIDKLGGRKFVMAILGILLCVLWAVFKLNKEYLILALGFVSIYITGNVVKAATEK